MSYPSRPTSPHLTIYRWQTTTVLSIFHRVTGVALYAGTLLLLTFLFVTAYAPAQYAQMHECIASPIGQALLLGWTLAFFYHFFNGIRHLFWDIGKGFGLSCAARSGWVVLFATAASTLGVWAYVYYNAGAFQQ